MEYQAITEARDVLSDPYQRGVYDAIWAERNANQRAAKELRKQREEAIARAAKKKADPISAEELRKQQEKVIAREERKIAKQMERQQERENLERRAKSKTKKASSLPKRATPRKLNAAKERENARWEVRQRELTLEEQARVKKEREAQILYDKVMKRIIYPVACVLFTFGAGLVLKDDFWDTESNGEDDRTSQGGGG